MKNKKGVSPLLAAVLLVALAITMSAIVSNYIINKTKEFNPEQLAEGSIFCESASLGFTVPDPAKLAVYKDIDPVSGNKINGQGVNLFGPITLVNRGTFSIHQLIISAPGLQSLNYLILEQGGKVSSIKPGANNKYLISMQVNPANPNKEIKIVPVIKDTEKNHFVKCTDRQLIINYVQVCADVNPGNPNCPKA